MSGRDVTDKQKEVLFAEASEAQDTYLFWERAVNYFTLAVLVIFLILAYFITDLIIKGPDWLGNTWGALGLFFVILPPAITHLICEKHLDKLKSQAQEKLTDYYREIE